ncbi:MAG: class II fructose-bisphosphate aldolase [Clostridia bacterium]|nr:class II fructose-bisphosphate aldolase [Clostridia bacterium]
MLVNLKEILEIAERENIAIGMFNATGFDSLQAVIAAAEELNQPVIIAHAEVHNVYNDISIVGPAMIAAAKNAKVPVCVHLDHGESMEMIWRALRIGFTSVMIDASALPYEENLALTKQVTEMAHAMGVSVEAELGRLVAGEAGSTAEVYTEM